MSRTHGNIRAALLAALALASLGCAIIVSPAGATPLADVRGGVYTDEGGFALGGGVVNALGSSTSWYFNPNIEAAFTNDRDVVSLNADVHYDFRSANPYNFYAGAGPALIVARHSDGRDNQTDGGLDLVGGINWHNPSVKPFVQMKGVLSNEGQVALMGGIRF